MKNRCYIVYANGDYGETIKEVKTPSLEDASKFYDRFKQVFKNVAMETYEILSDGKLKYLFTL